MSCRRIPSLGSTAAGLAVLFLLVPLAALVTGAPWDRLGEILASRAARSALWTSLQVSLGAVALSTVLGLPLAWLLGRAEFRGRRLLRTLTTLPMVVPPVVGGVALLRVFGRRGIIGAPLEELTGITVSFTTGAAVLAAAFVSMPFLVTSVEAGVASLDRRFEEVAVTLGAGRWKTLRRVVFPALAPSLGAGMATTWARAVGEFGATITFAGNVPGATQTVPLAIYLQLEQDPEVAYLLAAVLLALSLGVLLLARDWGRT